MLSITLDTHTPDTTPSLSVTPENPEDDIVKMDIQPPFLEKPVNEVRSYTMIVLFLINKKY